MLQNPQLNCCPSSYKELVRVYDLYKTGTHTKNKAPLLVTILIIKVEGVLTENYSRIRFYHSLERILTILRYRFQINTDPNSLFHPFRIRITVTVPAQFFSPTFKKILLLLIFFCLFLPDFCRKSYELFTENTR